MLISKNNIGIIITLILVILLSQSKIFNFLTETALGRMIILLLIILISYINKLLGLLSVLLIINAFNQYNLINNVIESYNYYEGFDISGNQKVLTIIQDKINNGEAKEDTLKEKLASSSNILNSQKITTSTSSAIPGTTTTPESYSSREGFCMTDRETNILRGKQSNTISVFNDTRNQDDNISPTDKSIFSTSYSSF